MSAPARSTLHELTQVLRPFWPLLLVSTVLGILDAAASLLRIENARLVQHCASAEEAG